MEKYFSNEEMDRLINDGKVEVIKRSERAGSHGLRRHLVEYNGNRYLLCNSCHKYLHINKFANTKGTFVDKKWICKECDCKIMKFNYKTKFISHLRYRYKSIESQSKKHNTQCLTFDEFVEFTKTEKDPIFQLTLEEAFNENRFGDFEVEHKHPISKGGTSLVSNLRLSYKPFNRLKGTMNVDEALEMARLIADNAEKIRANYQ